MHTCTTCGTVLAPAQILLALEDAHCSLDHMDWLTYYCSTYTDEAGCQGNASWAMAQWVYDDDLNEGLQNAYAILHCKGALHDFRLP